MATVAETQAYLTEAKAPTYGTVAQARTALKGFINPTAKMMRQAATWRELIEIAELSEPDVELRADMLALLQKIMAMERLVQQIRKGMHELAITHKAFSELDTAFRVKAAALGYTV
jgi:hypothetical protein